MCKEENKDTVPKKENDSRRHRNRIQAKDMSAHYQNLPILYNHYSSQS